MKKYWLAVASKDHVENGVKEGFCQVCHGKEGPLKKMKKGDWLIYYSGKKTFGSNQLYQKFTAIGKVIDDSTYNFEMSKSFNPFRRNIQFLKANDLPIRPLIQDLSFIKNKEKWGSVFRFGFLEIDYNSFKIIFEGMREEELEEER